MLLFPLLFPLLSLAQDSEHIVSLYLLGADTKTLVGSVIAADSSTTAYHVGCDPAAPDTECGVGPGANVTHSSGSLWGGTLTDGSAFSIAWECTRDGQVVCVESVSGSEAHSPGTSTVTLTAETDTALTPVKITAGAELLDDLVTMTDSNHTLATMSPGASAESYGASATASPVVSMGIRSKIRPGRSVLALISVVVAAIM